MPASSRGSPSAPYSLPLSPSRASTATTVSAVLSTGGGGGSPPSTSRSPSRSGRPPSRAMSALSNAESSSSSWTGKARDDLLEQPVVVPQTDDTLLHAVTSGGSVKVDRQHLPSPPILDADDAETTDSSFEQEEDAEEEEDSSSDEEVAGAPPPLSRAALQADDRPPDQHPTNGRLGNGERTALLRASSPKRLGIRPRMSKKEKMTTRRKKTVMKRRTRKTRKSRPSSTVGWRAVRRRSFRKTRRVQSQSAKNTSCVSPLSPCTCHPPTTELSTQSDRGLAQRHDLCPVSGRPFAQAIPTSFRHHQRPQHRLDRRIRRQRLYGWCVRLPL